MNPLDRALTLAIQQHAGQLDKQGQPYILHVLRVVGRVSLLDDVSEAELCVAALHDIVEDTPYDGGFDWLPADALHAIGAITRMETEPYIDYIDRVCRNQVARTVKKADLRDNLDPARPYSGNLRERYELALKQIEYYESEFALPEQQKGNDK